MKHLTLITALIAITFITVNQAYSQDKNQIHITPALSVKGYLEAYYGYDFSPPKNNQRPDVLYNHTNHNKFSVNAGMLGLKYEGNFLRSDVSFILGSISAGPIYAAFPVAITLLKKGASVTNVVVLLSSWAVVKIPMLANEAKFLGPKFMLMRWVLTTIAIFATGAICSKFVSREEILELHPEENFDEGLTLDSDYCIGCGVCVKLDPEHFAMIDKKAQVISLKNLNTPQVVKAAKSCPVEIIKLETSPPQKLKPKTAPSRS